MGEEGEFGGAPALLAGRCWPEAGAAFWGTEYWDGLSSGVRRVGIPDTAMLEES